jgi:hypothetical protein
MFDMYNTTAKKIISVHLAVGTGYVYHLHGDPLQIYFLYSPLSYVLDLLRVVINCLNTSGGAQEGYFGGATLF